MKHSLTAHKVGCILKAVHNGESHKQPLAQRVQKVSLNKNLVKLREVINKENRYK